MALKAMCVKEPTGIEGNEMTQEERQAFNAWAIQDLILGSEQRNAAKASTSSSAVHGPMKVATQDRVRRHAASTQIRRGRRFSGRYSGSASAESGKPFPLESLRKQMQIWLLFTEREIDSLKEAVEEKLSRWRSAGQCHVLQTHKTGVPRLFPARRIYPLIARRKTGEGGGIGSFFNSLYVPQEEMK
ncbi:hypothetical protein BDZ91DRAFT_767361 [Kalaharituber pfeilii]|nr:hypothetical protein BDZ91DRAFT_767361 [Kalaharituber pfeilii]